MSAQLLSALPIIGSTTQGAGTPSLTTTPRTQARRRCRWVKGIGLVCDTELGTVCL